MNNERKELKIFISSTMRDLGPVRERVAELITNLGHVPIRAETHPSWPLSPGAVIRDMVAQSNLILGIYGSQYGTIPPNEMYSVTEIEFEMAKEMGRECLVYIADDNTRSAEMARFIEKVEDYHAGLFRRPRYKGIDELVDWIRQDIRALEEGPIFSLFAFKEYARRLREWTSSYAESRWGGNYAEIKARTVEPQIERKSAHSMPAPERVSDILVYSKRILLLGEAGSGKTTALLHFLRALANQTRHSVEGKVPVFVPLNAWTEAQDLETLILSRLSFHGKHLDRESLDTYLAEGRFVLAFDGVNEIPSERLKKNAETDLVTFASTYHKNQMIVTSRLEGYKRHPFREWTTFKIEPLEKEDILNYVIDHLGHIRGPKLFRALGGEEKGQWDKPYSLITLVRNPLILWMLTETYGKDGKLPQDKGALIDNFLTFIFESREPGKASHFSRVVKDRLLRALAYSMNEDGEIVRTSTGKLYGVFSSISDRLKGDNLLGSQVTVLELLEEIQANGLLRKEDEAEISWSHQLFQDFYGAQDLAEKFREKRPIWRQLNNANWKESVVMAATLVPDPEEYVRYVLNGWRGIIGAFLFENPRALLAINCVNETRLSADERLRRKITDMAGRRMQKGLNQCILNYGEAVVSRAGRPFSGVLLRLTNTPIKSMYVVCPVLWALGEIHEHRALPSLTDAMKSEDRVVRWVAAYALGKMKDPSAFHSLVEALDDRDGDVRWFVVQALTNIGDPSCVPELRELLNHPDPTTRWSAAFALGRLGTEADLPYLEAVRETDHARVWWEETVGERAGLAVLDIKERTTFKRNPEGADDQTMTEWVYHDSSQN